MLETKLRQGALSFNEYAELAGLYFNLQQPRRADALMLNLLRNNQITPEIAMQIAQLMAQKQRLKVVEQALHKFTELKPDDTSGWINLAALQLATNKRPQMWKSIDQALAVDPEQARAAIRKDVRFNPIRNTENYKKRIPSPQQNMNLLPGF